MVLPSLRLISLQARRDTTDIPSKSVNLCPDSESECIPTFRSDFPAGSLERVLVSNRSHLRADDSVLLVRSKI